MANLAGVPGEFRFTIEVKRKDTGKVEKYDLIGHVKPGTPIEEVKQVLADAGIPMQMKEG